MRTAIACVELNDQNFDELVIQSQKPFIVVFGDEGCNDCYLILQILHELRVYHDGKFDFGRAYTTEERLMNRIGCIAEFPIVASYRQGQCEACINIKIDKKRITGFLKEFVD